MPPHKGGGRSYHRGKRSTKDRADTLKSPGLPRSDRVRIARERRKSATHPAVRRGEVAGTPPKDQSSKTGVPANLVNARRRTPQAHMSPSPGAVPGGAFGAPTENKVSPRKPRRSSSRPAAGAEPEAREGKLANTLGRSPQAVQKGLTDTRATVTIGCEGPCRWERHGSIRLFFAMRMSAPVTTPEHGRTTKMSAEHITFQASVSRNLKGGGQDALG